MSESELCMTNNAICIHYLHQALSECVSEAEVGQSESLPLLEQLLQCVTAIISAAGHTCHLYSAALFSVLLRIAASHHAVALKSQVVHSILSSL